MAKKRLKDTDYLTISAYLRAKEAKMLDNAGYERLLSSPSFDDAAHILAEYGYSSFPEQTIKAVNDVLNAHRGEIYADLLESKEAKPIIEIFARKYDYHNIKVMVKSDALHSNAESLLSDGGTIDKVSFAELWRQEAALPAPLDQAAKDAKALMSGSGDPQLVDIAVDKAYFQELHTIAKATRIPFIAEYVNALCDSANLRTAVRCIRMGRSPQFLKEALIEGGSVEHDRLYNEMSVSSISSAYTGTGFEQAATLAEAAISSGNMTALESACDEAVASHLSASVLVGFGAEVVLSYLVMLENEITSIRMILSGKLTGIATEVIRERLRAEHV